MSNPLNDRIAELLREIGALEAERDRIVQQLVQLNAYPVSELRPEIFQKLRPQIESEERLRSNIDSKRQKLISLELLMLDNSIKDLRSTTSQVDGSVKSLQTTTDKLLKSSTKLERLTGLLIYITIMLAIIAIYQVALLLGQSNPLYGAFGAILTFIALVYFMIRLYQAVRRGDITRLKSTVP